MPGLAAKTGAAAIVVSNHGGRQLDGAPSSISMLPDIADAVGSEIEILFDGGIRSGQDVMRALALGAKGCLVGRAYIYGLGAGGQAGVARAIEIIRKELNVTMALTGVNSIQRDRPARSDGLRRSPRLQPRPRQQAALLEHRIGHRGQQRVDLLEVADGVEVDRAGLDTLRRAVAQPHEMALAGLPFRRSRSRSFSRTSSRAVAGSREISTLKASLALAITEAWKAASSRQPSSVNSSPRSNFFCTCASMLRTMMSPTCSSLTQAPISSWQRKASASLSWRIVTLAR